ncbi:MAG: hypothetical protein ACRC77_05340 [Bacteroidales bacterium]
MRRLKLYFWSFIAISSVIFITCEMNIGIEEFIAIKMIAFCLLIWSALNIRQYKDIMEEDISKLEELIVPEEYDEEND